MSFADAARISVHAAAGDVDRPARRRAGDDDRRAVGSQRKSHRRHPGTGTWNTGTWNTGIWDTANWANPPRPSRPLARRAFTMVEIIIVASIVLILVGIAIPTLSKVRAAQKRTSCISTLRQIGGAFRLYASDNNMRLPDPSMANLSWEQMLVRYFRGPYACPSDPELYPAVGSSYDWRDTGDSTTTLAGRFMADVTRGDTVLAFEALPGWHGRGKINAARMDDSVLTMDADQCFNDLKLSPNRNFPATGKALRRKHRY